LTVRELRQPSIMIPVKAVHRDCTSCPVSEHAAAEVACAICASLVTNGEHVWTFDRPIEAGQTIRVLPKQLGKVPAGLIVEGR
jgi:hypothetical protein